MKKLLMMLLVVGILISAGGCSEGYSYSYDPYGTQARLKQQFQEDDRKEQNWRIQQQEYVDSHPKISSTIKQCILDSNWCGSNYNPVVIGMTKEEVLLCKREPVSINRTVGNWGVHEQWVYGGSFGTSILCYYFENGILIAYQN